MSEENPVVVEMRQMIADARMGFLQDVQEALSDIFAKAERLAPAIGEVSSDELRTTLAGYAHDRLSPEPSP